MTRNLTLAAIASLSLVAAGCLGAYDSPQGPMGPGPSQPSNPSNPTDPTDPTDPVDPPDPNQPGTPVTPSAPTSAKPDFVAKVATVLTMKCGLPACHGGTGTSPLKFVGANNDATYDLVTGYSNRLLADFDKANAQLVTKVTAGHYGVTYAGTETTDIGSWIDLEKAARATGGNQPATGPAAIAKQLIEEWSGCMDLNDWNQEGVAAAWANRNTGSGQCIACHVNNQGNFLADELSQRVFDLLTTRLDTKTKAPVMEGYFVADVTTDPANPKIAINRAKLDRAATGVAQHPTFNVEGNAYTRLTNFYNKTMARKTAGTCAPKRLVMP
jgi:hypothetical protein